MALTPRNTEDAAARRQREAEAEQAALMREVDESVRADDLSSFGKKYAVPIGAAVVVGLAAFGGYLWWDHERNAGREAESEQLIQALDQIDASNYDAARTGLEGLGEDGGPGVAAAAEMLRAGAALERGDTAEAAQLFDAIAEKGDTPPAYAAAATIRSVAAQFDQLPPADVIARLAPYAKPGNPWFGSAGEMTAAAYLKQDRADQAGPLLAQIAQDETMPESLRQRTRQLAGLLGYDAITDVETLLEEQSAATGAVPGAGQ